MTYKTGQKNKHEQRVVAELRRGRIPPGGSDNWEGVTMRGTALKYHFIVMKPFNLVHTQSGERRKS